ncbi:ribonuclease H family protein, partial [Staphylococcus pseudintermedius]|uniref:hypothetical protein n=1 Tax=Staphylococcus pseudintermedius TaxID=283734 RepID=UPI0036F2F5CF
MVGLLSEFGWDKGVPTFDLEEGSEIAVELKELTREGPVTIENDNRGCQQLCESRKMHERSRHWGIETMFLRD